MRFDPLRLLAVLLAAGSAGAQSPGDAVDRVVAVVDGEPITLSETREFIALNPGRNPPPTLDEALETLIEARLMEREARRYPLEPPTGQELDRALRQLRASFDSVEAYGRTLERLGIREDYLRKRLRESLIVERYLDRRFLPLVQVSGRDIEAYYRTVLLPDLDPAADGSPDQVRDLIRDLLVERDLNRRIAAWVDELKSAARIERLPAGDSGERRSPRSGRLGERGAGGEGSSAPS